jgi:hypothetical protein
METLAADERIVLDRMLSESARRLDGAVDFWTIVCLSPNVPQRQEFLRKNLDELRALLLVTKILWPQQPEAAGLLAGMMAIYDKLETAFQVLVQFQTSRIEDVRSATTDLAHAYSQLREAIQRLAQTIELEVTYSRGRTPQREEYFQNILRGLFDLSCKERAKKQPIELVSS